jgi:DNA-binding transcriptional MerR regulator
MRDLAIGELAARTNCKVQTVRYYEEIGLMPLPPRSAGGQRRYSEVHVGRLGFIRHARDLGFEVEAIRQLLALSDQPDRPCGEVDQIARRHLAEIDSKIERLSGLRKEMQRLIRSCGQGRIADCRVIGALAEHGVC